MDEIIAYQAERKAIAETPVGKAFHSYSNASAAMWREDNNDRISEVRSRRLDNAYREAEANLIREIKKLLEAAK